MRPAAVAAHACSRNELPHVPAGTRHAAVPPTTAHVALKRDVKVGERLKWADVAYDAADNAVKVRREMEAVFGRRNVG
jgi:predicted homoserine dehydrogenase-like protein